MRGFDRSHPDESNASRDGAPEGVPAPDAFDGPIPDELIDALLDGDGASYDLRAFRSAIGRDEQAQARLDSAERALDALRCTPSGADDAPVPDFTSSILGAVDRRRGLFGVRGLRLVAVARVGLAAAVLLAGVAMFVAHRMAPDTVTLAPRVTPISDVVRAMPAESAGAFSSFKNAAGSIRQAIVAPVERATRSAPCPKSWQCALHRSVNRSREASATGAWPVTQVSPESVWLESLDQAGSSRVLLVKRYAGPAFTGRDDCAALRQAPITAVAGPEPVLADRGAVFSDR